jgi:hypothetical protein
LQIPQKRKEKKVSSHIGKGVLSTYGKIDRTCRFNTESLELHAAVAIRELEQGTDRFSGGESYAGVDHQRKVLLAGASSPDSCDVGRVGREEVKVGYGENIVSSAEDRRERSVAFGLRQALMISRWIAGRLEETLPTILASD